MGNHCTDIQCFRTRNFRVRNGLTIVILLLVTKICAKDAINSNNVNEISSVNENMSPVAEFGAPNISIRNNTTLRLSGIDLSRSTSIRFKATFSPVSCDTNANEFDYTQRIEYKESKRISTDIDISVRQFDFEGNSIAYLCAMYDGEGEFVHLGNSSMFSR